MTALLISLLVACLALLVWLAFRPAPDSSGSAALLQQQLVELRGQLAGLLQAQQRVPDALFWTVSGSHLYGFPSADSDIDLRGCFRAPLRSLVGLKPPTETVEPKASSAGVKWKR